MVGILIWSSRSRTRVVDVSGPYRKLVRLNGEDQRDH